MNIEANIYNKRRTVENCKIEVVSQIYVNGKKEEDRFNVYENCTADIWRNSATGKQRVGWRRNFE